MSRDISRQYLAGILSSKVNYRIEDRLLENDFCYDAFEGLEQVSWKQCQNHLEAIESRIIDEFNIEPGHWSGWKLTLGIIGILTALTTAWYLTTSSPGPTDFSRRQVETTGTPPVEEVKDQSVADTIPDPEPANRAEIISADIQENQTIKLTVKTSKVAPVKPNNTGSRITVGRIIDAKGIPLTNAKVRSGEVTDSTDKSGYYALKVPGGGIVVKVVHLATEYEVEIDSNQNWEIVLDIARQVVVDYYPMNAANRFR